ncbi:MAG: ABC transporter permease [Bryobacteraceae bacterium]
MSRWLSVAAVAIYAFLHMPLAVLAIFSFNRSRFTRWEGWSLAWYRAIGDDPRLVEGALNSLWIALTATLAATAIGTLAAYAMRRRPARLVNASLRVSLVTPEIVTGVSLLAFFQWTFRYLDVRLGMATVILAHVAFSIAYVVLVIEARLKTLDPSLEEAALDLGASPWQAFRTVTLPLLGPGIAAAALLAFTVSFDDYVITSLVAGVDSETLPMVIYGMARRGVSPVVNAISALIVVAIGVLIVAAESLQGERR